MGPRREVRDAARGAGGKGFHEESVDSEALEIFGRRRILVNWKRAPKNRDKICRAQALLPTPSRRPHDRRSMRWVERVVRERVVSKSLCTGETNQRPLERTATYRPYPAGDVALSGSRPVNREPIDIRVAPCQHSGHAEGAAAVWP